VHIPYLSLRSLASSQIFFRNATNPKIQQKKIQLKTCQSQIKRNLPFLPRFSSSWDTSCEKLKEEALQTNTKKSKAYLPTPSKSFFKNQISFGTSLFFSF
jgi:hypothetical protein